MRKMKAYIVRVPDRDIDYTVLAPAKWDNAAVEDYLSAIVDIGNGLEIRDTRIVDFDATE
jgi:hypothetical protein